MPFLIPLLLIIIILIMLGFKFKKFFLWVGGIIGVLFLIGIILYEVQKPPEQPTNPGWIKCEDKKTALSADGQLFCVEK